MSCETHTDPFQAESLHRARCDSPSGLSLLFAYKGTKLRDGASRGSNPGKGYEIFSLIEILETFSGAQPARVSD